MKRFFKVAALSAKVTASASTSLFKRTPSLRAHIVPASLLYLTAARMIAAREGMTAHIVIKRAAWR